MRSRTSLPADFVTSLLANENLRGLGSLALFGLAIWLLRQPLADAWWNVSIQLGINSQVANGATSQLESEAGSPGARLEADSAASGRERVQGLPPVRGLRLEASPPELWRRINTLSEQLDFSAELKDGWPARNMLRLGAPYGCQHWFVLVAEDRGFHLYRLQCGCGHSIDVIPDISGGKQLDDPRQLVEYYRGQECGACRRKLDTDRQAE